MKEGYKSMKNKHKSLVCFLLLLKLIVSLQKISCIQHEIE